MTRPLQTGKKTIDLAAPAVRVSRIRRDPPPPVKEVTNAELKERDQWTVVVGVIAFALAFFVIIFAFGSYAGWSPREYTVEIRASE